MKIFLTGSTGFIGSHIKVTLVNEGHEVYPANNIKRIDFNKMLKTNDWLQYLEDIDVVINAVGIISENSKNNFDNIHHLAPKALFNACVKAKVKKVIHISALGADKNAFSKYHLSKKAGDAVLRQLPLNSYILRPSLVYGEGGKSYKFFQFLASLPIVPLLSGGKQLIQPVYIDDLTKAVSQCLKTNEDQVLIDVVGEKPVKFKDFLYLLRKAKGKPKAITFDLPFKPVWYLSHLFRFFSPFFQPENLKMLENGNTADVKPFADFLGYMPKSIQEMI